MMLRLLLPSLFTALLASAACAAPTSETAVDVTPSSATESTLDPYLAARLAMVDATMRGRDITDERVLSVMESVPRHAFVPDDYLSQAYEDHPLPIGHGQTISQPYVVALMTELLGLQPGDKVLEIGTGSGYQAAVLAELVDEIWTIEIIPELAEQATERFQSLGYDNVHTRTGDGYFGWPEAGPFDAIIVTAAPDHVPQPLLQQLSDGGRLVVPVGPPGGYQTLWQLEKEGEDVRAVNLGGVRFVPLVGGGQGGSP